MVRLRSLGALIGSMATLCAIAAAAACSLGLDESLIDKAKDSGFPTTDGPATDGEITDGGGSETGSSGGPDASACAKDEDCPTTDGCLKGKCDLTRKSCAYDVCRPSACNAGACNEPVHTCAPPTPYKLKAGQFSVGAQAYAVAAVHPWLYVATVNGLLAFNVSNPASTNPKQVPVVGLGFIPNTVTVSGSRVWLTGGANGTGPSRIQLAYIDGSPDPFAKSIKAQTFLPTSNRPAEGPRTFGRANDSVLLVSPSAPFFGAAVDAPIVEPLSITSTALGMPGFYGPSAMSGTRLLASATQGQSATFAFIDNAGSATPTTGPVSTYSDAGAVSSQRVFAQSPDGAIFWATGVHTSGGAPSTRAVRGYFLVPGAAAPIDPAQAGVDIEVYPADAVGPNTAVFGPSQASAALLDAKTAMIATMAKESDQQTAVQFVQREPLAVIKDGPTIRRQVLPIPVGAVVAAAASNGVGYIVANDQAGPPVVATVYTFDPACSP